MAWLTNHRRHSPRVQGESSIPGVVSLLSKDFVKLIIFALLIASPIAWFLVNKWLQNFVYRVEIKWWHFASTGAAAVLVALITVSYQSIKAATANPVDRLKEE
ncbi:MAG: hypothetical protein EOP04_28290 [Proteobacteria bacterium]|nr:MAG: hypothetical protein EOP04_28290 [Pseudomonadota bacterium]